MNILLAGGGTGGHVYPGLAIAEALRRRDSSARVLFVGSRAGMEASLVPASGVPFVGLAVRPPRSRAPWRLVVSAASVGVGLAQAFGVVARFRPDVVIATGGVAAVPSVIVAAVTNVPVVVLEGNALPGRTNRTLARYSRVIAVSSDEAAARLPAGRTVMTGLPIRREAYTATREDGLAAFGLDRGRKTVLIIGGSQGAARLNAAAEETVRRLASRGDLQVLHQVGRGWSGVARAPTGAPLQVAQPPGPSPLEGTIRYLRVPYIQHIGAAYACADLVVSRCGANALAEITANGRPSILVPYPFAADDHQTWNASAVVAAGGAVLIPDAQLTGERLAGAITDLFDTPGRLEAMAASARSHGRPDAADRVIALVSRLAEPLAEGVRG
jgi:UDP-N-acetylglucosamine--N-acetylmuramyl-(pentapeptide) pyrophosphoryl-undecaprenol N-acetylglucosamine transferase